MAYYEASKYKDKKWIGLRSAVLARDEYICQECKRKGKTIPADTVHHIDPIDGSLFYDSGNLISFCSSCHNKMHDRNTDKLTELGKKWLLRARRGLVKKIIA